MTINYYDPYKRPDPLDPNQMDQISATQNFLRSAEKSFLGMGADVTTLGEWTGIVEPGTAEQMRSGIEQMVGPTRPGPSKLLGSVAPSILPYVAPIKYASVAGQVLRGGLLAFYGAAAAGQAAEQVREYERQTGTDVSPETETAVILGSGLIEALSERMGLDYIAGALEPKLLSSIGKAAMRKDASMLSQLLVKGFVTPAAVEGAEEFSSQIGQNALQMIYDDEQKLFEGGIYALAGGAVGGAMLGGVGVGHSMIRSVVDDYKAEKIRDDRNKILERMSMQEFTAAQVKHPTEFSLAARKWLQSVEDSEDIWGSFDATVPIVPMFSADDLPYSVQVQLASMPVGAGTIREPFIIRSSDKDRIVMNRNFSSPTSVANAILRSGKLPQVLTDQTKTLLDEAFTEMYNSGVVTDRDGESYLQKLLLSARAVGDAAGRLKDSPFNTEAIINSSIKAVTATELELHLNPGSGDIYEALVRSNDPLTVVNYDPTAPDYDKINAQRLLTNPNYTRWAKGNQLTDEDGLPIIARHGTPDPSFAATEAFRLPERELGFHVGSILQSNTFVSREGWQDDEGGIIIGTVRMRNPIYLDADLGRWDVMSVSAALRNNGYITEDEWYDVYDGTAAELRRFLQNKGYDGIVYNNEIEGYGRSYLLFDRNNFKSLNSLFSEADLVASQNVKMAATQDETERSYENKMKVLVDNLPAEVAYKEYKQKSDVPEILRATDNPESPFDGMYVQGTESLASIGVSNKAAAVVLVDDNRTAKSKYLTLTHEAAGHLSAVRVFGDLNAKEIQDIAKDIKELFKLQPGVHSKYLLEMAERYIKDSKFIDELPPYEILAYFVEAVEAGSISGKGNPKIIDRILNYIRKILNSLGFGIHSRSASSRARDTIEVAHLLLDAAKGKITIQEARAAYEGIMGEQITNPVVLQNISAAQEDVNARFASELPQSKLLVTDPRTGLPDHPLFEVPLIKHVFSDTPPKGFPKEWKDGAAFEWWAQGKPGKPSDAGKLQIRFRDLQATGLTKLFGKTDKITIQDLRDTILENLCTIEVYETPIKMKPLILIDAEGDIKSNDPDVVIEGSIDDKMTITTPRGQCIITRNNYEIPNNTYIVDLLSRGFQLKSTAASTRLEAAELASRQLDSLYFWGRRLESNEDILRHYEDPNASDTDYYVPKTPGQVHEMLIQVRRPANLPIPESAKSHWKNLRKGILCWAHGADQDVHFLNPEGTEIITMRVPVWWEIQSDAWKMWFSTTTEASAVPQELIDEFDSLHLAGELYLYYAMDHRVLTALVRIANNPIATDHRTANIAQEANRRDILIRFANKLEELGAAKLANVIRKAVDNGAAEVEFGYSGIFSTTFDNITQVLDLRVPFDTYLDIAKDEVACRYPAAVAEAKIIANAEPYQYKDEAFNKVRALYAEKVKQVTDRLNKVVAKFRTDKSINLKTIRAIQNLADVLRILNGKEPVLALYGSSIDAATLENRRLELFLQNATSILDYCINHYDLYKVRRATQDYTSFYHSGSLYAPASTSSVEDLDALIKHLDIMLSDDPIKVVIKTSTAQGERALELEKNDFPFLQDFTQLTLFTLIHRAAERGQRYVVIASGKYSKKMEATNVEKLSNRYDKEIPKLLNSGKFSSLIGKVVDGKKVTQIHYGTATAKNKEQLPVWIIEIADPAAFLRNTPVPLHYQNGIVDKDFNSSVEDDIVALVEPLIKGGLVSGLIMEDETVTPPDNPTATAWLDEGQWIHVKKGATVSAVGHEATHQLAEHLGWDHPDLVALRNLTADGSIESACELLGWYYAKKKLPRSMATRVRNAILRMVRGVSKDKSARTMVLDKLVSQMENFKPRGDGMVVRKGKEVRYTTYRHFTSGQNLNVYVADLRTMDELQALVARIPEERPPIPAKSLEVEWQEAARRIKRHPRALEALLKRIAKHEEEGTINRMNIRSDDVVDLQVATTQALYEFFRSKDAPDAQVERASARLCAMLAAQRILRNRAGKMLRMFGKELSIVDRFEESAFQNAATPEQLAKKALRDRLDRYHAIVELYEQKPNLTAADWAAIPGLENEALLNLQDAFDANPSAPSVQSLVREYVVSNLLSSPPTIAINAITTGAHLGIRLAERAVMAGIDWTIQKFKPTYERIYLGRDFMVMWRAATSAFGEAGRKFTRARKTGLYTDPTFFGQELGDQHLAMASAWAMHPNPTIRKLGPYMTWSLRLMIATDIAMKTIAFRGELAVLLDQEHQKWLKNNPNATKEEADNHWVELANDEKIMRKASNASLRATFNDAPGPITRGFIQLRNSIPYVGWLTVPFVNTITNLGQLAVELTPGVGAVINIPAVRRFKQGLTRSEAGGRKVISAQELIARQIEGSILLAILFYLFPDEDRLTGAAPKEANERAHFYQQGKIPYAIRLGNKWYSYDRFDPFSSVLRIVASVRDFLKQTESMSERTDIFTQAVKTLTGEFFRTGWLDSIAKFTTEEGIVGGLGRIPGMLLPSESFLRTVNRSLWGYQQGGRPLPETPQTITKAVWNDLVQIIPMGEWNNVWKQYGMRNKINMYGEEIRIPENVVLAWLPMKVSPAKDDIVEKRLGALKRFVGLPGRTLTVQGLRYEIPDDIYYPYAIATGAKLKQRLERTVGSAGFPNRSLRAQLRIINRAITLSRKRELAKVRRAVWRQIRAQKISPIEVIGLPKPEEADVGAT